MRGESNRFSRGKRSEEGVKLLRSFILSSAKAGIPRKVSYALGMMDAPPEHHQNWQAAPGLNVRAPEPSHPGAALDGRSRVLRWESQLPGVSRQPAAAGTL